MTTLTVVFSCLFIVSTVTAYPQFPLNGIAIEPNPTLETSFKPTTIEASFEFDVLTSTDSTDHVGPVPAEQLDTSLLLRTTEQTEETDRMKRDAEPEEGGEGETVDVTTEDPTTPLPPPAGEEPGSTTTAKPAGGNASSEDRIGWKNITCIVVLIVVLVLVLAWCWYKRFYGR